jgi:Tol biopolymer transport system component
MPFYAPEIFLMHIPTRTLTLLTHNAGGADCCPAINASGTRVAFNAPGARTFVVDTITRTVTQLTTTAWSGPPAINASGTRIAIANDNDLTGENPDYNFEIFLFNTSTRTFTQLTPATGYWSDSPAINASGTRIAFVSRSDLTGENPDHNWELFLIDTTTRAFTQLTRSTGGGSEGPAINASGTRIAFTSRSDLTGENPDRNWEIFLVDTTTRTLTQVTRSTGGSNSSPTINASGTHIAFVAHQKGRTSIVLAQCLVPRRGVKAE